MPEVEPQHVGRIIDRHVRLERSEIGETNRGRAETRSVAFRRDSTPAFGIRSDNFVVEIVAAWDPPTTPTTEPTTATRPTPSIPNSAHTLSGGYPNLIGPGQTGQADAAYGPSASRLLAINRRYDPRNVFSATPLPSSA